MMMVNKLHTFRVCLTIVARRSIFKRTCFLCGSQGAYGKVYSKGMMDSILTNVENWLDEAIAIETAQIDRLSQNKRILQHVKIVRNEREDLREVITRLEVEEERQRRFKRPSANNHTANNTSIQPNNNRPTGRGPGTGNTSLMPLAEALAATSTETEDADMTKLLPKQLDSILALAQNTREGKLKTTTSTASTNTTSSSTKRSTTEAAGTASSTKKSTNLSEMHAKYKVMTPAPHMISKLPNQPLPLPPTPASSTVHNTNSNTNIHTSNNSKNNSSSIQPLAAFVTSGDTKTLSDDIVDATTTNPDLLAARHELATASKFQALYAFEEQLSHLARFRVFTKVRYPTVKIAQTDKLHQAQLQVLHSSKAAYLWQGHAGQLLPSLLSSSSTQKRQYLRHLTQQFHHLLRDDISYSTVFPRIVQCIQLDIRRLQQLLHSCKALKRIPPVQGRDLLSMCATLQYWQQLLVSFVTADTADSIKYYNHGGHNNNNIAQWSLMLPNKDYLERCFWQEEMAYTRDMLTHILDRLDFGLTDLPITSQNTNGQKAVAAAEKTGVPFLQQVLLQYAALLQVQVASLVKYEVLSMFLQASVQRGVAVHAHQTRLHQLWEDVFYTKSHPTSAAIKGVPVMTRSRTHMTSELQWIEYLQLLKLVHAVVAHDASTLSSCVFVRK